MWDKLSADVLQELTADTVLEEELGPRLGIVMDMVEALERFRRLRTKKAVEDLREWQSRVASGRMARKDPLEGCQMVM